MTKRSLILSTLGLFATSVLVLGIGPDATSEVFEGRLHRATGNAIIAMEDGRLVAAKFHQEGDALEIDLSGLQSHNVYFEPVDIPEGGNFSAELIGSSGQRLARYDLTQTEQNQTDVGVSFPEIFDSIKSGEVTILTRLEGETTHETTLEASPTMSLGTVHSENRAWVKTWHVVCEEGQCSVVLDPENTVIEFSHAPGEMVPFRYLIVQFELSDPTLAMPGTVRFSGQGVDELVVTDETIGDVTQF